MLQVATDLRSKPSYQMVASAGHERAFRLVAGIPDFAAAHRPDDAELPRRVRVTDVFPNPFSVATTIRYEVPAPGGVQVRVYNALGQEIARLDEAEVETPGARLAVWDGTTLGGTPVPGGVYFIQVTAGGQTHAAKVVRTR